MIKLRSLLILFLVLCSHCLFAQSVPAWGGGADDKDISFGFSFGYVSSYFKIDKKADWRNPYSDSEGLKVTDSIKSIGSPNSQGFAVGFLSRFRLTNHLEARVTPALIFADRNLDYTFNTPSQNVNKAVQATMIDIPLLLKLKSDRIGDLRVYITGGLKYSQAIGTRVNSDAGAALADKFVKNVGSFTSYEAGLGFDIYFEFFKLSPEIKLSNSFGDVMLHENHPYSRPIDKLSLHAIMFSLHFE
jgi:hypothetical protein